MQFLDDDDDEVTKEEVKPSVITKNEDKNKHIKWYKPYGAEEPTEVEGLQIHNCDEVIRNVLETGKWDTSVSNCHFLLKHWRNASRTTQSDSSDSDRDDDYDSDDSLEAERRRKRDERKEAKRAMKEMIEAKVEEVLEQAELAISNVKRATKETNPTLFLYAKDKHFEKFCKVIDELKRRNDFLTVDTTDEKKEKKKSTGTESTERLLEIKKNMPPSYYEDKYRTISKYEPSQLRSPSGLAFSMYECINAYVAANRSSMAPHPQHLRNMVNSLRRAHSIQIPKKSPLVTYLEEVEAKEKAKRGGNDEESDEVKHIKELITDESSLIIPHVREMLNLIFGELLRLCQNSPSKNYEVCLEIEHVVLNQACAVLEQDWKYRHAVKLSEMILKVVCKRSQAVHIAMEERYGKLPITIEDMWKRASAGNDPETFLCYLYYVAQRDVVECRRLLREEFVLGNVKLFGDNTDMELPFQAPVEVKIAYNRLMAQMAMSFFRQGDIDAATELVKALYHGKDKDISSMLGQRVPTIRWNKNVAPRVTAFFTHYTIVPHCQIDINHLEIIYLICSVMENPLQRKNDAWGEEEVVSPFEKFIEHHNIISGPPVNDKERVKALNTAIEEANAKSAVEHIRSIKVWGDASGFLSNVEQRVREACLRMFLYTKGIEFEKITVDYLKGRFGMDFPSIRRVVNEALLEKDSPLIAFWDSTETMIQFERGNVSRLARTVTEATKEISLLNLPLPDHERRYFRGPSKSYNNNYRRKQ